MWGKWHITGCDLFSQSDTVGDRLRGQGLLQYKISLPNQNELIEAEWCICLNKLGYHWFRYWLVACLVSWLSVDIFCWGSAPPTFKIYKGPKQYSEGSLHWNTLSILQFFWDSIGPSGKISQGPHWIFRGPGPLPPGPQEPWVSIDDGLFSIGPKGIDASQISIKIQQFSFNQVNFKTMSAKWQPFYLSLQAQILKNQAAISVARTFWNYTQSTAVSLPCFVQENRYWWLNVRLQKLHCYSGVPNSQTRLTICAVTKRCQVFFHLLQ